MTAARKQYVPIDELLERPAIRLLRSLRRFGWVEAPDLYSAAGFPDSTGRKRPGHLDLERYAAMQTLSRLVRRGHVERCHGRSVCCADLQYRITAAGRAELDARMLVADVSLSASKNDLAVAPW